MAYETKASPYSKPEHITSRTNVLRRFLLNSILAKPLNIHAYIVGPATLQSGLWPSFSQKLWIKIKFASFLNLLVGVDVLLRIPAPMDKVNSHNMADVTSILVAAHKLYGGLARRSYVALWLLENLLSQSSLNIFLVYWNTDKLYFIW